MTPFQALFGDHPKNAIDSLKLPPTVLQKLKTEEDLEKLLSGQEVGSSCSGEEEEPSLTQSGMIVQKIFSLECHK